MQSIGEFPLSRKCGGDSVDGHCRDCSRTALRLPLKHELKAGPHHDFQIHNFLCRECCSDDAVL
jgi:hypothetical protein